MDEEAREGPVVSPLVPQTVFRSVYNTKRLVLELCGSCPVLVLGPAIFKRLPSASMPMPIQFRHDVDQVLKDAKAQQKPVLLDFSAAPM